jgi:alkylation response protein AidB-like acyl-CoA dehydrogenase
MDFAFTDEQAMLRDSARGFFARHAPPGAARARLTDADGYDPAAWRALGEMGWLGVDLPAEVGGLGLGLVEMAIILEQAGESLCPLPFFASAGLAARAVLATAEPQRARQLLGPIVAGDAIATLACCGRAGVALELDATLGRDGSRFRLDGAAGFVPFGHVADLLLVAARDADDPSVLHLLHVAPDAAGLTIDRPTQMDLLRPEAQLRFDAVAVPATALLGTGPGVAAALRRVIDRATILVAAEQVGGAQRCLALSLDHARQRIAFGRPIGSFQAIKHRLADMAMQVETARSAAYYAACLAQEGDDRALGYAAAMAKVHCADAFSQCAGDTIQIHGGIGFTWEHDAHLLFKQAHSAARLFGSPDAACQRMADLMELA